MQKLQKKTYLFYRLRWKHCHRIYLVKRYFWLFWQIISQRLCLFCMVIFEQDKRQQKKVNKLHTLIRLIQFCLAF